MSKTNKKSFKQSFLRRAALAAAVGAVLAGHRSALAVVPDTFKSFFFDPAAIGGFAITPDGNTIYKANFSPNMGFSSWTFNGTSWVANGTSVGPSDMTNFEQSTGLTGNGSLVTLGGGGQATIGGMALNPTSITINRAGVGNVTYAPGTLAYVMDSPSNVTSNAVIQYGATKIGYWYDLRQIDSANTASGSGTVDRNNNGNVDWNDPFEASISRADARSVAAYSGTTSGGTSHRPAFSSNGQVIYFDDQGATNVTGGLWRVDLANPGAAGLTRILTSASGFNTDPTVVSSAVRDFGGGTGDQVVVVGSDFSVNPNVGGVSYVVDNAGSISTPKTLITAKQIQSFLETSSGITGLSSFTSDAAGNVYIADGTNGGVYRYDANGRLSKVMSRAEQAAFVTSSVGDGGAGGTSVTTTLIKTSVRDGVSYTGPGGTFDVSQFMYPDSSAAVRAPVGVNVFKTGDFNRDNVVNAADIALFKGKLGLRGAVSGSTGTSSPFTQLNMADSKYDLNGSIGVGSAQVFSIDWKDAKIFQQFAGLADGDVNMDFAVDTSDLEIIRDNYNANGRIYTEGNISSVKINATDKDFVNYGDLVTLAANWTSDKPNPLDYAGLFATDVDRAFAVTAAGTISQYVNATGGADTWANAASWSGGVEPNAPGAVASLLTKAGNDTTLTISGSKTVGQLNFDNFYSYTVTGGTLHLQGAFGTGAEVNALSATPIIASALVLDSNTTYNVADTSSTVSGAISGTGVLTKTGVGALLLTGTNSFGGATTVSVAGGTLQASKPAALPGYNSSGKIAVVSGATLAVNAGGASEFLSADITSLVASASFASGSALGIDTSTATFTHAGAIAGSQGLTKLGTNTLRLTGTNNFAGPLNILAGTASAAASANLGNASATNTISLSGSTLALTAGMVNPRNVALQGTGGTTDITGTTTFTGVVSGGGTLTKSGTGTLVLTNTNSYSGLVAVTAGMLSVSSSSNLGDGSSTNNISLNNGTLALTGSVNTSRNVALAGTTAAIDTAPSTVSTFSGVFSGNGALTKSNAGTLVLTGTNTNSGAVNVNGGTLVVAAGANLGDGSTNNRLNFNGGTLLHTAAFNNNRAVTLNAGGGTINNGGGIITYTGLISGTGALTSAGSGKLVLTNIGNNYSGATNLSSGTTMLLQTSLTTSPAVNVNSGALLKVEESGGNRVMKTAAITASTGQLDITDNKLIVTTAGAGGAWNGTGYTGISGLLSSGRNGGTWTGNGIVTTMSDASVNQLTTLAVATASEAGKSTFAGATVAGTDVLVMYTYTGDADLNGKINADDYFQIDSHANKTANASKSYFNGDYNYDGQINGDDYYLIDNAFVGQGPPLGSASGLAGVSAVPEPSLLGAGVALAMGLRRSRRRRA